MHIVSFLSLSEKKTGKKGCALRTKCNKDIGARGLEFDSGRHWFRTVGPPDVRIKVLNRYLATVPSPLGDYETTAG
jgi:hypothetical protein